MGIICLVIGYDNIPYSRALYHIKRKYKIRKINWPKSAGFNYYFLHPTQYYIIGLDKSVKTEH